jgi:NAD(P)-dependent dehydrogenase (short-subunit alcohol dehydrogenase family)
MTNAGKTAIVTGASQGIGAGLVDAFLKRGYSVVATSRNITKANPFPASGNLALVDGDIGDPETAAKIVNTAVARFGRIDVLVFCGHDLFLRRALGRPRWRRRA